MNDFDGFDLSEPFVEHLRNLTRRNGADGCDLEEISSEYYDFLVYLNVVWEFYGECKEREMKGAEAAEVHFGEDLKQFEKHAQSCLNDAKFNPRLHEILLCKLRSDPQSGVAAADNAVKYYDFKPFSAHQKCTVCLGASKVRCDKCSGRGKTNCASCGGRGRKSCSACGGSGGQNRAYTQYRSDGSADTVYRYEACSACGGSGSRACSACYGSGYAKCSACSGDGYVLCPGCGGCGRFTYIRNIRACAKPRIGIKVRSTAYPQELREFLCGRTCEFISQKIPFYLKQEDAGEQSHSLIYKGRQTITQLRFEISGKSYVAAGLGTPPFAFIRPAIFDDLFADELAMLEDICPRGKMSRAEAFGFFDRFVAKPALDTSLKQLARSQSVVPQDAVERACDGYISQQAAKQLGDALKRCLNKISPVYSPVVWFGLGSLFWLFALIFTAGFFGENFTERYLLTPLCGVAFLAICLVASWCVLTPLSALVTMFRRRKVPAEYRTGMQNQKAFVKFRKILIACCLLGAFYGIAASLGYAPSLYELDARFDLARNLGLKKGEQTDASSAAADRKESGAEISMQNTAPQIGLSQKEKILYIQKSIGAKQDGVFGARTLKKAREVLDQNLSGVDEIYEALKSKEQARTNPNSSDQTAP